MNDTHRPPQPLSRPKFAQFLWSRDLDFVQAGRALGRTKEWVRRICLPFDDPRRRIPSSEDMRLIFDWSQGEISPADFYPPDLQRDVSDDSPATPVAS